MFINIFGGITRGDQVALGIVEALNGNDVRKVPMVIRLTGTNAEEGRKILADGRVLPGRNDGRRRRARPSRSRTVRTDVAIFLDKNSKVIVQGITGREGALPHRPDARVRHEHRRRRHARQGRHEDRERSAVFNTVKDAVDATGATHSIIFVPPFAGSTRSGRPTTPGIEFAVCITEGSRSHEMLRVVATTPGMRIIGPNCPGSSRPASRWSGSCRAIVFKPGNVGMISRSGTLTYEIVDGLTRAGLGQSTCVGIGGDPIIGTTFVDCLREFANDPETTAVVVAGEIGGASDEEDAADFIREHIPNKPVVAFIGGRSAPKGSASGTPARSSPETPGRRSPRSRPLPRPGFRSPTGPHKFLNFLRNGLPLTPKR